MVNCCQPGFSPESCSGCPEPDDISTYYQSKNYSVYDITIQVDDFGQPIHLEPLVNPNILDFATTYYKQGERLIDPFSEIAAEMDNIGLKSAALGIILLNSSLCSDPTVAAFNPNNNDAVSLFGDDFSVDGKTLVIVYHLWQNPDGSGNDKLYTRFLWANRGSLEEIDVPLDPANIGVGTNTDFNFTLTDPEECIDGMELYEVQKDENGVYYGYDLVNCRWQKGDVLEFIEQDPYPFDPDDDQYNIGRQSNPTVTTTTIQRVSPAGIVPTYRHDYFPCKECYLYTKGDQKDITTNDLIKGFYSPFEFGWEFQNEKDILFNSFIYGKGQSVVWNTTSSLSSALRSQGKRT